MCIYRYMPTKGEHENTCSECHLGFHCPPAEERVHRYSAGEKINIFI